MIQFPARAVFIVVLDLAILFAGACGQPPSKNAPLAKFDSPEACFEAITAQKDSNDVAAILQCLSEAHANFLAGNMAFQLQRYSALSDVGDASAACVNVLKTHGLGNVDIMGFLQIVDSPRPGGATPGFMQIGESISNKQAFFRDAKAAMAPIDEKLQKLRSPKSPEKAPTNSP